MTFPENPLPVSVEMYLGEADGWVDITDKTRAEGHEIFIRRGFPNEGSNPEPSSCTLTLDNRAGDFTPRNPLGQYYGKFGRNTPIEVAILESTEDTFDRIVSDGWGTSFSGHWGVSPGYSWSIAFPGGTASNFAVSGGEATMLVDGAGETRTATLSGAPSYRDSEVRVTVGTDLGGAPTGGVVTVNINMRVQSASVFYQYRVLVNTDGSVDVSISAPSTEVVASLTGVPGLVFTGQPLRVAAKARDRSFSMKVWDAADPEPGDWTISGTNEELSMAGAVALRSTIGFGNSDVPVTFSYSDFSMVSRNIRYTGEVSEWPPRWDVSDTDRWVRITAQGVLRRLGQGSPANQSPLKSSTLASDAIFGSLVAYWPMEDVAGATSFASALPGGQPARYSGAAPDFAATGPLLGSDALPILASTTSLTAAVPPYTDPFGTDIAVRVIFDVLPTPSWSDNTPLLRIEQSTAGSTVAAWEVRYRTGGGDLEVRALDDADAELATSGTLGFDIDGKTFWLGFTVGQDGADAEWTLYIRTVDDDGLTVSEGGFYDQTFSSLTVTTAQRLIVAPDGGLQELGVGHLLLSTDATFGDFYAYGSVKSGLVAYAGELAGERAPRLSDEAGVPFTLIGNASDTVTMGPQQTPSTFLDALAETYLADQGLLYEPRDTLGLALRTRRSLYNQTVALTLDYEAPGEIAPDLEPIDDDQLTRNDVTVQRKAGGSARYADTTSRLSLLLPPAGVGRYEDSVTVNLLSEGELIHHAAWRVHLGTWDEPRFLRVAINLTALAAANKFDLIAAAARLDVGDRLQLVNLLHQSGVVGTADLMAMGFTERIGLFGWSITLE